MDSVSGQQRARRDRRTGRRHHTRDHGRKIAHRNKAHHQKSGSAIFESAIACRREHSLGRSGGEKKETCRKWGRQTRSAAWGGRSAPPSLHPLVFVLSLWGGWL